ncbi:MAG: hypothetical protein KFW21_00960 [Spirochaetota bacterium]|nr:hypothetical protein [Spirochaetota bacterium]
MKKIVVLVFLFCINCVGSNLLLEGEQIGILWNGKYTEELTGNAYLNIGIKQVDIRNIDNIPTFIYTLDCIIEQKEELKVWLKFDDYYLPMKMTRDTLSDSRTQVYFDKITTEKKQFPTIFETNILMIRY